MSAAARCWSCESGLDRASFALDAEASSGVVAWLCAGCEAMAGAARAFAAGLRREHPEVQLYRTFVSPTSSAKVRVRRLMLQPAETPAATAARAAG